MAVKKKVFGTKQKKTFFAEKKPGTHILPALNPQLSQTSKTLKIVKYINLNVCETLAYYPRPPNF
jgi:hypothetical protein